MLNHLIHLAGKNEKYRLLIISLTVLISTGGYIFVSHLVHSTGFPLDDAWIHQTYARNLATYHEWSFIQGQISSGSTSPLWSMLLAIGYLMGVSGWVWAMLLGAMSLIGLAWFGDLIMTRLFPSYQIEFPAVALLLSLEWHLVWAAVSGMETALYAFIILLTFFLMAQKNIRVFSAGLVVGISIWIRPDGITLLGPLFLMIVTGDLAFRTKIIGLLKSGAGFLLGFTPYLFFNRLIAGAWWPNTFYAKQAEYASMIQLPLLERFVSLFSLPLIGVGVLLFPGFLIALRQFIKNKNFFGLSAVLWWIGYTGIYMLRLPVIYQHGRYLMPAMPVFFIIGLFGTYFLFKQNLWQSALLRIGRSVWILSIVLVLAAFWVLGAFSYGEDVAIIQTEMVQTAKWIQLHTAPGDLIAVHDIGAIGYFSERNLVDLAGLISPDVIPFIRDEDQLMDYLDYRGVEYLVTFPAWYPEMTQRAKQVYSTQGKYAIRAGGENMGIFEWR